MDTLSKTQATGNLSAVSSTRPTSSNTNQGSVGNFVQGRADQVLGNRQSSGAVKLESANAPATREANAAPVATDKKEIGRQQQEFIGKMKAAGIEAHNPPTQDELKKYFATFNNKDKRGQALEQYENYTRAFHVHTAEVKGKETQDVHYSPEKTYVYKGQLYNNEKEARAAAKADPGGTIGRVSSSDASQWSDVAGKPDYNGRKVQDCEGFAYMSQELLGSAGYQVTHTNNKASDNTAHSMTVVKDPDSGKIAVTSNDKAITGAGSQDDLLKKGWEYAGGKADPGTFYTGDTQAHAQARQVAAEKGW